MALANDIDICNLALDHLGKPNITSFTDGSVEGPKCQRQYGTARRTALSKSPWTFARKTGALGLLAANALSDVWEYCYDLPNDMVKLHKLIEPSRRGNFNEPPIPMYLEDGKLYTNLPDACLRYVYDNKVTLNWSDMFDDTVALALAVRLAPSMTRRRADVDRLREAYVTTLAEAVEHDATQDTDSNYRWGDGYADARGTATLDGPRQADGSSMWG